MNIAHSLQRAGLRSWFALCALAAAVIGGCGGGVGTGGTGSYAQGTINGFGSIFVNDVRYDDTTAAVVDANGNTKTRDDLRLGMTVSVEAGAVADNSGGPAATASRIQYASEMVGPLAAVDRTNGVLVVLGQTVTIDATTVFDDRLAGGVAALAPGQLVEVYADDDPAGGRYRATRIEPHAAVTSYSLRGIASQLSNGGRNFKIGSAAFSFAGTPPSTLVEGGFVRVTLQTAAPGSTQWVVQSFVNGPSAPPDGQSAHVKGLISSFASAASFSVNGQAVTTAGASFPDGSAGLALGVRVEIEGTLSGGVLRASQVSIQSDSEESGHGFELRGNITSVDLVALTFKLRGVTVSYASPSLELDHGTLADILVGRRVEVRGVLSSDGTQVDAQRITFDH